MLLTENVVLFHRQQRTVRCCITTGSMSFSQIFRRLSRILQANSRDAAQRRAGSNELRQAEEFIREANERDMQEQVRPFQGLQGSSAPTPCGPVRSTRTREEQKAYIAACQQIGVSHEAPLEMIVRAFRREIAHSHPDKVHPEGKASTNDSTGRTRELIEAFAVVRQYWADSPSIKASR